MSLQHIRAGARRRSVGGLTLTNGHERVSGLASCVTHEARPDTDDTDDSPAEDRIDDELRSPEPGRPLSRSDPKQPARARVLDHPQRAIRCHGHVANLVPDGPALGGRGAALPVERDPGERLAAQATNQG